MKILHITERAFHALIERINQLETRYEMAVMELVKDRLYSSKEVCEILGVSTGTLQNYRDSNRIKHIKAKRRTFYRWKDIQDFINSHKRYQDARI